MYITHQGGSAEVFYTEGQLAQGYTEPNDYSTTPGWYWWACFPGCLPDGEAIGPFETEAECIADFKEDLI